MSSLLRNGILWLAQQQARHCASQITYGRGDAVYHLAATPSDGVTSVDVATGAAVEARSTDFIIVTADFPVTLAPPQSGDRIAFEGVVYEVADFSGSGHWQWSDPHHLMMRIRTKEVGVE